MATSLKVKLLPLLEWTQVKEHGGKSDLVAVYSKNEKDIENVYFQRKGVEDATSTIKDLTTDVPVEHATSTCDPPSFFDQEIVKQSDHNGKTIGKVNSLETDCVTWNNKQPSRIDICRANDLVGDETDRNGCTVDKGQSHKETHHFGGGIHNIRTENNFTSDSIVEKNIQIGQRGEKENCNTQPCIRLSEDVSWYSNNSNCNKIVLQKAGLEPLGQEAILATGPETVSDGTLVESIKPIDGTGPAILDKNDDRYVPINEHSGNEDIGSGYEEGLTGDTVTQTDNSRRSAQDLQGNRTSYDSCGDSGGKSWIEGCSGCKHKHPAVRTIAAAGERRDGGCYRSDCSQVDPHPHFPETNERSNCVARGKTDGNVEFVSSQKGVVKYNPSLTWSVQLSDSCSDPVIEISHKIPTDLCAVHPEVCKGIFDVTDHVTRTSVQELLQQSDPSHGVGNLSAAGSAGAMLANSNSSTVPKGAACSAYNSIVADNYNKLSDASADDSAVHRTLSMEEGSTLGKNKYKKRANVKGAITDNKPGPHFSGSPCCPISPAGPPLENKSVIPGPCALHIGLEPTSKSDGVDKLLKWEIYKAEACQTELTFSCGSSNIRRSNNGNSGSCDEEGVWIECEEVFFSSNDQLPSGVEGEGMPHVGDTVDSQNSCYGIQQPGAAARVPSSSSNTNAKLSIGKTSASLLQLPVGTGKAPSRETSVPVVETHSEGRKDTSSPISSDAPNSASAGQSQSYAAVLRENIKADYHNGAGKSSCPTSQTNVRSRRAPSHRSVNSPERRNKQEKSGLAREVGGKMGNQNSSGVPGDRSRTPVLGRRKNSSSGLFRAASSTLTRSVPVTPAGTPASIRSEKTGFFRKFRRNKNRSRSDSMASINSISSTASTVSHGYPGRGFEDNVSRDSQSSLAMNSGIVGDCGPVHTMAGTAPPGLNTTTPPGSVNVPAPPHSFKQQATILQPISERPNEAYQAQMNSLHSDLSPKNDRHLAEKIPDHISDGSVAHRSLSLIKRQDGTTGSNLTLTDDGSEYLTASETDLSKGSTGKNGDSIKGFNCDNYKVTNGTHSQSVVGGQMRNKPELEHRNSSGQVTHFVDSSGDGARSNTNIELLHERSAGSLVPDQVPYHGQHKSRGANTPSAPAKSKKPDKKKASSKAKQEKNQASNPSKTYAAVLGTGLFIANFSDSVSKDSASRSAPDVSEPRCASPRCVTFSDSTDSASDTHQRVNFPCQPAPAAPVCQVESTDLSQVNDDYYNTNSLPRSFAAVVNSPSATKRVVHPPRGPFGSLTRKESSSGIESDTVVSEADQMPLTQGLHGKLPVAASKHGIRTSHKPVNEPIVHPQSVSLSAQAPPTQNTGNYKNVRPRTFATVAGQGGGKGQRGVKTVPGGNAGSPATTPDGSGGVICHSLPRSTLSSAGSAPALGVCGARLRAAKAHSVQQLNATRSPPMSPTRHPEHSPFVGTSSSLPQQAKSMPQLAGRMIGSKDDSAVPKVKSVDSVKVFHVEASSLPRLSSQRTRLVTLPKPTVQVTKSKTAVSRVDDHKSEEPSSEKYSNDVPVLVVHEPTDQVNRREDKSFEAKHHETMRVNISDSQECVSESSGSLHRLNTSVQLNADAKNDKTAKSEKQPVTQIPHKERKTAAKSGPDGREMPSKVPMHTQKVCPPGQSVSANVGEAISTGNVEQNSRIDSARQTKSTVSIASKLPASSPNKQKSVANDIKSPESAFNQDQTKQLVVNANSAPAETTKTDTNNYQVKHEKASAPKIQNQRPLYISSQSTVISVETCSTSGNNQTQSKSVGYTPDVVQVSSNVKTPTDVKLKQSAISTVDYSKQENKSGSALEENQSSAPVVDATANTTKSQPVPEPTNDLTRDDEEQQKEGSETSQSAEEVAVVTSQSQAISKTSETSQHEKLTIEVSGNLEHQKHTLVSEEKVPTPTLVFTTEEQKHLGANSGDTSISNDQLKADVTKDESGNRIMGSGESKVAEDEAEKVPESKPSQNQKSAVQEGKYDPDGGITGVSDKSRSNEKVGAISSDSTTVKGSQLPVKVKTEPETNLSKLPKRGDAAAQRSSGPEESGPQAPPRSHRPTSGTKSQQKETMQQHQQKQQLKPQQQIQHQQQRIRNETQSQNQPGRQNVVQKDQGKSEAMPTPSLQSESLGNAKASTVKNKVSMEVKNKQSVVEIPTNNSVTRRDGSDKITCPGERTITAESAEKPKVGDQTTRGGPVVDKQSTVSSVDISRTMPSSIPENNTTAGVGLTPGANSIGESVIINTCESKPSKMEGGGIVHSERKSESVTKKSSPVEESAQCKLDADMKDDDPNRQISLVTQDTAINSKQDKQTDKQTEPVDKHAVNIVECKDVRVPGPDSDQENRLIVSDNDTCEATGKEADGSSGSKPKIFDEMISVKDVNIPSESSSAFTILEMDEKIQDDTRGVENSTASEEGCISQVEASLEGSVENRTEIIVPEDKHKETAKKVKISIEQTESIPEEVPLCAVTTKPKIITEEEVTFTIDIPAECARSGKAKPEVNVYVSATCIAVTSTSGTINTTAQLGGNETTTSVSDDGQAVMSVSGGPGLPLTCATAGGAPLSSHQKDETPVNICVDVAPSTAGEAEEGSTGVKHAGQEEAGKLVDPAASAVDEAASGVASADVNVHTQQVEGIPEIVVSNEPANDGENDKGRSDSETLASQAASKENNTSASNNVGSCTFNAIKESGEMAETRQVQHMDAILSEVNANAQFGSPEEKSTSLPGGNHSDKPSPTQTEENSGIAEQHAEATTTDPISISKASESEQAHSTEIASREGGGCDPGNPDLIVEEISVSRVGGGTDTASINTAPQIAITAEIANKDSVVESTPAECNVNNSESGNLTDYLTVDDHLRLRRVESDSSSIGRLIHSSDGEHSDLNLDDILVRNMEECNIKVNRFGSESSEKSDSESDGESSAKESESEEDNNKINSRRKAPHTVNDSDLSDDMCDKLKASKKIENVEETSSDDESDQSSASESEDEKPKKKCVTDEENHIKPQEELGAKSPDDCYATKLENMGHKVGEPYFVTRRRKRAKMVDRETITQSTHEVQCPEVCHVSTDTFDSILISSSGSSDTSPSRVQWEDDSVDELDAGPYEYYSDEEDGEYYEDYSDGSVYSEDEDSQLGATAAGPVKVIYSRPRPRLDSPRGQNKGFPF